MAESSTPLELVEAYRLIKAGQRQDAGKLLKAYLAQHGRDPKAWWLMAHAVDKPENVRRCLETVLKLDPNHAKAREKLARLDAPSGSLPPPVAPFITDPAPAPAPVVPAVSDEPDDSFFGVKSSAPVTAAPATAAPSPRRASKPAVSEVKPVQENPVIQNPPADPAPSPSPSFEEFVANTARFDDPFAPSVLDDPFADVPPQSAPGADGGPAPNLDALLPKPPRPTGENWGLGDDFTAAQTRHGVERTIGFVVVAFALLVAVGLILVAADRRGLVHLSKGDKVPGMTVLDSGSFQIDYPKGWNLRCLSDASGYPVCGIANHPIYNEVDYYAGEVNLGLTISENMTSLLTGGDLPDQQVSIIVMDVPRSSPSYDDSSLAKTRYEWEQEWEQQFSFSFDDAKTHYDRQEITVDGLNAYYYEFTSEGTMNDAAWDVYVEHDGIILWLRVSFLGPKRADIPHNLVEKMIQSIHLKPVSEWTP